jgi:hypothetical protein
MPVHVKGIDTRIEANKATIRSPELVEAMIKNPKVAKKLLANEVGPVDLKKVSIDDAGRLVVRDPRFARRLKDKFTAVGLAGNGVCGANC